MITFYGWLFEKFGAIREYRVDPYDLKKRKENTTTFNYAIRHAFGMCSYAALLYWFGYGACHANDPNSCRIKTIGEFVITAPYAIGCNLFKERFDIKIN